MSFYRSPFYSPFFPRLSVASPISRIFDDDFFSPGFPSLYSVYDEPAQSSSASSSRPQQQRLQDSSSSSSSSPSGQSLSTTGGSKGESSNTAVQGSGGKGRSVHHHHHHPLSLFSPLLNAQAMPELTVDMFSTPAAYSIHASVPGIDKKDIQLTIEDGNVLRIQAERREERRQLAPSSTATLREEDGKQPQQQLQQDSKEETKEQTTSSGQQQQDMQVDSSSTGGNKSGGDDELRYHHVESYYGRVERRLQLPEDADLDGLAARHENGVLKITLPRLQEKKNSNRRIEVQ